MNKFIHFSEILLIRFLKKFSILLLNTAKGRSTFQLMKNNENIHLHFLKILNLFRPENHAVSVMMQKKNPI